jgi:hypothetical protein
LEEVVVVIPRATKDVRLVDHTGIDDSVGGMSTVRRSRVGVDEVL